MQVPWTRQRWALPFLAVLAVLAPTPDGSQQVGLRHKTLGLRAHQVVSLLRHWRPGVPIKLIGDLAYRLLDLGLPCTRHQRTRMAPCRRDSVIHQPTPPRSKHTLGRPPVVGPRLPSLERVLPDPQTVWQRLTLDGSGEGQRMLEVCTGTAWWSRFGSTPLPIRWVLTRDPAPGGKAPSQSRVFHRPDPVC